MVWLVLACVPELSESGTPEVADSGAPGITDSLASDSGTPASEDSAGPDDSGDGCADAVEACDGIDDDCDLLVDEACHPAPMGEMVADATFLAPTDDGRFTDMVAADLDGDGADELVFASFLPDVLSVLAGPFHGTIDLATT